MIKTAFFILFAFSSLQAQNNQNTSHVFNTFNSGLPADWSACTAIDNNQIKWIASGGLTRFDGVNWKNYNTSNSPLTSNAVSFVVVDKNNVKWITASNAGLFKLQDTTWTHYTSTNSNFPALTAYHITVDKYNNKWISTLGGGLVKFDDVTFTVYKITNSGIPDNIVNCTTIDRQGNIWIGTQNSGLVKFDGTDNWTVFNTSNSGIPYNWVHSLAVDSLNNKWVGCAPGGISGACGLAMFDQTNWLNFDSTNSNLYNNGHTNITSIGVDKFNNKWFATDGAYFLYKLEGNVWKNYSYDVIPFPTNSLSHINFDKYNNAWISLSGGLIEFNSDGIVNVHNNSSTIINGFELSQNYPNPFNGSSIINYKIGISSNVEITVFDILGKKIKTLVQGFKSAGSYQTRVSSDEFSSGIYFYNLKTDEFAQTKSFIIIR